MILVKEFRLLLFIKFNNQFTLHYILETTKLNYIFPKVTKMGSVIGH